MVRPLGAGEFGHREIQLTWLFFNLSIFWLENNLGAILHILEKPSNMPKGKNLAINEGMPSSALFKVFVFSWINILHFLFVQTQKQRTQNLPLLESILFTVPSSGWFTIKVPRVESMLESSLISWSVSSTYKLPLAVQFRVVLE